MFDKSAIGVEIANIVKGDRRHIERRYCGEYHQDRSEATNPGQDSHGEAIAQNNVVCLLSAGWFIRELWNVLFPSFRGQDPMSRGADSLNGVSLIQVPESHGITT